MDQNSHWTPIDSFPASDTFKPSVPLSFPIKTIEELESRSYFRSFHFPFNKASISLSPGSSAARLPNRRRLLVCHDMAGGYSDDMWIQGGSNAEAYVIYHWYMIDVFVYFSHSLVTLPPPCWTNAAHKHGVKALGTFITESDEGRVICERILSTKDMAHMYAERLAEIAFALGFDGWLINIEVILDVDKICNLKDFVNHLTQIMHTAVPGSLVIWYDSITFHGDLCWQNQLNEKNKPFFDLCDGLFVNYSWKEDYPKLSAVAAGDRKFDVYMGIDVFGRGTYGGGQWNTNVALEVLKKYDVSAAIFAPGWIYETKQLPDFRTAQNRWWALVEKSWGALRNYPTILPFVSNFDQGCGLQFCGDGEQLSIAPWFNISCQNFQPFADSGEDSASNAMRAYFDFNEDSYSGGGNITFSGRLGDDSFFKARLFQTDIVLADLAAHVVFSVKAERRCMLGLLLEFYRANERVSVVLASSPGDISAGVMNILSSTYGKVMVPQAVKRTNAVHGWMVLEYCLTMKDHVLAGINALCFKSASINRKISPKLRLEDSSNRFHAVMGHIRVGYSGQNPSFPSSSSWEVWGEHIEWASSGLENSKSLNLCIFWKMKDESHVAFPEYRIHVLMFDEEMVFLGVAHVEAFYVSNLAVACGTDTLRFFIQACHHDGVVQKLSDSPSFLLVIENECS